MKLSIQTAGSFGRSLVSSQWFWYSVSASALAALTLLPVALKWDRQTTLWAFGGTAIAGGAAWMLSKEVERSTTKHIIKREIGFQVEVDETVHMLNTARALMAQEIQLIEADGQHNPLALPGMPSLPALPSVGMGAQMVADGQQPQATTQQNANDDYFETEDLAALMARNATVKEDCGSVLIACPKGTGKSNLLRAAIAHANTITNGMIDFSVFNAKEDRDERGRITSTFCGLEKSRDDYINAGEDTVIPEVARRLQAITDTMESRRGGHPMVQILDEYNNLLIAADTYDQYVRFPGDRENPPEPKLEPLITYGTIKRGTKGRSKLVSDWITSHSPFVKDLKLNTALQESYTFIVLGRGDKLSAIHSALKGSRSVVKNETARADLKSRFEAWENAGMNTSDRVVALTNMGGKWRLVYLPQYPDHQPDITRSAMNQSTEEIMSADSRNVPADSRQPTDNVPKGADETPRNTDVSRVPDIEMLQRCMDAGFQDLSRNGFGFDNGSNPVEPLEKRLSQCRNDFEKVLECKRSGLNQKETIIAVWGIKAGESARYEECRRIYQAIASEIRDNK